MQIPRPPYLLLHANNPVDWYPWGPEAFAKAQAEDKPIFLSVGYSTCFWCHVAERTLYSDPKIAALMNKWFVNVKVDREQRPDVDRAYMLARQLLSGAGGWPNNVFLTPDRRAFYAGSYFPPERNERRQPGFPEVLETIHRVWTERRPDVLNIAARLQAAIEKSLDQPASQSSQVPVVPGLWNESAARALLKSYDGCGLHLIFFMIPDEIVSITIEGRDIAVTTPSITRDGDRITIQVEVTLSGSMLACEESILDALNEAGSTATREALQRFDTDGARLELGGQPWFSQGRQPKYYQTPYGEVEIERHVYQRSHGGKTFCPLERDGRIVVTSTPRFAKVISHKFSTGSSTAVRTDLMDNHARTVARSYLQRVAEAVGAVAQAKEESWSYATPRIHGEVASVAIGLDGTCKLLCEQGWREAMTGTISLYDGEGERLHTIYLGATPEYGKGRFVARLEGEIAHVRSLYPSATYVGVADGAQCNWDILSGHTDEQILDFYHASGYVGDAAKAAYPGDESERARWIRERCHALKHRQGAASRILKQMRAIDTRGLSAERRDKLDAAITYFANHKHQMHYSRYRKQSLPMGSGVTEAACKTLIKQRLCQSGMRWKDKGAGIVLSLRSLMLTRGRWQQFWAKLDQYGMPALR